MYVTVSRGVLLLKFEHRKPETFKLEHRNRPGPSSGRGAQACATGSDRHCRWQVRRLLVRVRPGVVAGSGSDSLPDRVTARAPESTGKSVRSNFKLNR